MTEILKTAKNNQRAKKKDDDPIRLFFLYRFPNKVFINFKTQKHEYFALNNVHTIIAAKEKGGKNYVLLVEFFPPPKSSFCSIL